MPNTESHHTAALAKRRAAAERYKPAQVNALFIAEAPPCDEQRYFYFADVADKDSLWVELTKLLYADSFGATSDERKAKHDWLRRFRDDGYYLIDSVETSQLPQGKARQRLIQSNAQRLIAASEALKPGRIILIKATVYDGLYAALRQAGLPVIDCRIPFPGSGQQRKFRVEMQRALDSAS
ncbi:MAG: hypothetical protein ACR2P7_01105 [bacterium]